MRSKRLLLLPSIATAILSAGSAAAYNVFPFGTNQALKWGASNQLGTPGGIVTWSLMPDGTALDPLVAGFNWSGTSNLASVYAQVGGQAATLTAIRSAFNAWSAVADIQFVQVDESGVLPFGAAVPGAAVVGHIRIGAFAFAPGNFTGAVGYAPPPNGGTTLEGDVYGVPEPASGAAYAAGLAWLAVLQGRRRPRTGGKSPRRSDRSARAQ